MIKRASIALLGLLLGFGFAHAEDMQAQVVGPFGTLNNTDTSLIIPSSMAQDLLNVDITPGGRSVKKRRGYGVAHTLSKSTSPVHGVYDFFDGSGNEISLYFNDRDMAASTNGGSSTVIFSTGTNGATWQCVDSQGFAYCASSTRDSLIKTNGVTASGITATAPGTMVAVTPERLVLSGFAAALNRVDFSKANDFTTWTVGGQPTDPITFTITSPGSRITHITYAFGRLVWFKDTSMGYILEGPTLGDWVVKTVSPTVGTLDNTSVYRDGILYFRGQDGHLYAFDGSNPRKLSRDIGTTIDLSQIRRTNSWTQTTAADFDAGVITTSTWLTTTGISGSVILSTTDAVNSFVDTNQADFQAGTETDLDDATFLGSLILNKTTAGSKYTCDDFDTTHGECAAPYYAFSQSFTSTNTFFLTGVRLRLRKDGAPSNYQLEIHYDSSGLPGASVGSVALVSPAPITTDPAGDYYSYTLGSPVPITAGTRYWIQLIPQGTCASGSDAISVIVGSICNVSSEKLGFGTTTPAAAGEEASFQLQGNAYLSSGTLVSRTFDVGVTTQSWLWNWSTFSTERTIPSGTSIIYETQTSSDSSNWAPLVAVTTGNAPTSAVQRYIRYKATLAATSTATAKLDSVTIPMSSRVRPFGTFSSAVKTADSITTWDTLGVTYQDNGGSHTFSMRSATGVFTVSSSTPAWTTVTAGAIPSISTGTYFQFRDLFSAVTATGNPKLDDFTIAWFEGSATDKSYGVYFKESVWWSVTSGTGTTTNNYILKLDLLNNGFTLYNFGPNGFFVRNNGLYFGGSTAGKIYKFGDVDNDDGSAINAYWKSKDFIGQTPFVDNDYASLSISALSVANSSMTVTYAVNGSSETSYTVPLYSVNSTFTKNNRNLPPGRTGSTLSLKFGNNAQNQPFEVYGALFGYRPKPWKVNP